ncbi:MAG: hypothetical protein AAGM38_10540 [Pseudomonadota bacterium]
MSFEMGADLGEAGLQRRDGARIRVEGGGAQLVRRDGRPVDAIEERDHMRMALAILHQRADRRLGGSKCAARHKSFNGRAVFRVQFQVVDRFYGRKESLSCLIETDKRRIIRVI